MTAYKEKQRFAHMFRAPPATKSIAFSACGVPGKRAGGHPVKSGVFPSARFLPVAEPAPGAATFTHPGLQAMADTPASLMANSIRALAMDAVQQANSGHPGAPMGMADMAVALWGR